MDTARWRNLRAARESYGRAETESAGLPLEAFFEVAARCNLRCQMCAINHDSRYRPGNGRPPLLEPEIFERLAPIFPYLLRAYLFGLGERQEPVTVSVRWADGGEEIFGPLETRRYHLLARGGGTLGEGR